MPRTTKPLTKLECEKATYGKSPRKLMDGQGLFLLLNPNGSKLWRLKYFYLGKEKLMAIGPYPLISLAEARDEREKARKLLTQGIDPISEKRTGKALSVRNAENTFKVVALEWMEINEDRWSDSYHRKVKQGLEKNIFPQLGSRPVSDISPPELLSCLRAIEKRGSLEIAARTRQICGLVFRFGIQTGKCTRDPSADFRGALKPHQKQHYRTIEAD
ncbi:MAG: integrase, partial [Micavibrio aeruginosavorus]